MADTEKDLRDDVRLLGSILGDSIRELDGDDVFDTVESVRNLAKEARRDPRKFEELSNILTKLSTPQAATIARAFSHFLTLANIAEQHHRIRRRRFHEIEEAQPQKGSIDETFDRLLATGTTPDELYDGVCNTHVGLVFTAHPTEVARRTMAQKHYRVAQILQQLDHRDLTPLERSDALDALRREIASLWETDEVRHSKPTPVDEAKSGLIVFEQSLWEVVPAYLRRLDRALRERTGRPLPLDAAPIRFGSWMGGDRDGNPNVTPEVTRVVCLLSKWMAADLYAREVGRLRDELSMHDASAELRAKVGDSREPYRELLRDTRDRLQSTREAIEAELQDEDSAAGIPTISAAELHDHLLLCDRSLRETGNVLIAEGRLLDLIRRHSCFGLTLARLDIRQDSARHTAAMDAVTRELGLGAFAEWDESRREAFLVAELEGKRPLIPRGFRSTDEVNDVLDTFAMLARIPRESLGNYVITMASNPSDVLLVELLQREAAIEEPLHVVPLFETAADLQRAAETMRRLVSLDWYAQRINGRQEVMIGYSDSSKDAGRLAAAWHLYKAQEQVVAACSEAGVEVTLFHGRGGSVGRGGGPTYLAIQSQPPSSIRGSLRVTEQGEMIQAKFGLPGIAQRTLEIYTTATLEATLRPGAPPRAEWRETMERLAAESRIAYRSVVYEEPRFVEYFRDATPEVELSALHIGSRPSRRRSHDAGGVESLRAIPWQFAWTQNRLMLPAWLGTDEALSNAIERGDGEGLQSMYRDWTFFRSIVDLIAMVLAKADGQIASYYDRVLVAPELQPMGVALRERLARAIDSVMRISGHRVLLESNRVLRRSIDVRNPYVDPINVLQVELLRRLRIDPDDDEILDAFRTTVTGIAAGMRNTG